MKCSDVLFIKLLVHELLVQYVYPVLLINIVNVREKAKCFLNFYVLNFILLKNRVITFPLTIYFFNIIVNLYYYYHCSYHQFL